MLASNVALFRPDECDASAKPLSLHTIYFSCDVVISFFFFIETEEMACGQVKTENNARFHEGCSFYTSVLDGHCVNVVYEYIG